MSDESQIYCKPWHIPILSNTVVLLSAFIVAKLASYPQKKFH